MSAITRPGQLEWVLFFFFPMVVTGEECYSSTLYSVHDVYDRWSDHCIIRVINQSDKLSRNEGP
jgi:hypothetical protein